MAMKRILLASGNPNKVREISALLQGLCIEIIAQSEYNVPDVAETGLTFVENALLKARNACAHTGLAAIADDSGLEVDALHGAPGIYSARYAGVHHDACANNAQLLQALREVPPEQRTARFQCVIVYLRHVADPTPLIAQGTWEGRVLQTPRGTAGFGYDPLFFVPTHDCSAAELPADIKNSLSHRGQALRHLAQQLSRVAEERRYFAGADPKAITE